MGMFDWVNYTAPCPKCGAPTKGWQTKDSACSLSTVEPWEVGNFYTNCGKCQCWIEAYVERPRGPYTVTLHTGAPHSARKDWEAPEPVVYKHSGEPETRG